MLEVNWYAHTIYRVSRLVELGVWCPRGGGRGDRMSSDGLHVV